MPRKKRCKSSHKQSAIKHNVGIAAWRMAASEYLCKGAFLHLPKRGTPEHAAMKARQQELIPQMQAEIDMIVACEEADQQQRRERMRQRRAEELALLRAGLDTESSSEEDCEDNVSSSYTALTDSSAVDADTRPTGHSEETRPLLTAEDEASADASAEEQNYDDGTDEDEKGDDWF